MHESLMFKLIEEIVDNALKFSESNSDVVINAYSVYIQAEPHPEKYIIEVINSGRGMTNEQISNIGAFIQFDRNYYETAGHWLGAFYK